MKRHTGTFSRYAFALLQRVLPGLERRRIERERRQLLRLAVEQDRLHRDDQVLSYGQQCVLTLLRDGWELRHMSGVGEIVDGWYVVKGLESIDISSSTGNALKRKGLITKKTPCYDYYTSVTGIPVDAGPDDVTPDGVTLWKEAEHDS